MQVSHIPHYLCTKLQHQAMLTFEEAVHVHIENNIKKYTFGAILSCFTSKPLSISMKLNMQVSHIPHYLCTKLQHQAMLTFGAEAVHVQTFQKNNIKKYTFGAILSCFTSKPLSISMKLNMQVSHIPHYLCTKLQHQAMLTFGAEAVHVQTFQKNNIKKYTFGAILSCFTSKPLSISMKLNMQVSHIPHYLCTKLQHQAMLTFGAEAVHVQTFQKNNIKKYTFGAILSCFTS